jgi:hypothetical protein
MKLIPMTHGKFPVLHTRSPLGLAADLVVVLLCALLVAGFVAQVWKAPHAPELSAVQACAADPARC